MKRFPQSKPARTQATPDDLVAQLMDFLERKFYAGHPVVFAKDRRRLLEWVVLWPARWLDARGVSIPPDVYRQIFMEVFMDGLRFGNTENITYFPAYLAKIIQSHFAHHGEEIYNRAKSIRTISEHTILTLGKLKTVAPDPVREMANAARLLRPKKKTEKNRLKSQLTLL